MSNREDIIRMAREASNTPIDHHATPDLFGINQIERFAALVIANHPPQSYMTWQEGYEVGKQTEREACAGLCDRFANRMMSAEECADAIRARGQA